MKKNYLHYRRDGTVHPGGLIEWARDFDKMDRVVKQQRLWNGLFVSTVFLGLDHNFGQGPPLIFETMVFPNEWWTDWMQDRYSTEEEAFSGHYDTVQRYRWWPLWAIRLAVRRLAMVIRRPPAR